MAAPLNAPRLGDTAGSPEGVAVRRRRRRPSGEPPPLPHKINASGAWWLILAVCVGGISVLLALSSRSLVNLVVADNAILQRIAERRTAWLTDVMKAIGLLATGPAMQALWLVNLVIMVIWRRWRHLLVWLASGLLVVDGCAAIAEVIQRPRPVGIEILGPWKGYAMPSLPLAVLAAFLVNTLYAAVPAGTPRNRGKLAVAVVLLLVRVAAIPRAGRPTDALFGVVIGVAVPLVAFRVFVPNDVFPVTYHRGRTAHLDVAERRHDAILHAFEDQLGLIAIEVKPFGLEGSGGSHTLTSQGQRRSGQLRIRQAVCGDTPAADRWYKLGSHAAVRPPRGREAVQHRAQARPVRGLRVAVAARPPACRCRIHTASSRSRLSASTCWSWSSSTARMEVGDAEIDESDHGSRACRDTAHVGGGPGASRHQAGQLAGARRPAADDRLGVLPAAAEPVAAGGRPGEHDAGPRAAHRRPARVRTGAGCTSTTREIAEAFAATRGLTMPSQLRRMLRTQGEDLHAEFLALLPYQLRPVRIQRWSVRRVGLSAVVIFGAVIVAIFAVQLIVKSPL